MTRTRRIFTALASLAAAAAVSIAVSIAVPTTALADDGKTTNPGPCDVTGAYAWQDNCTPAGVGGNGQ